jgi:hypothetical protein
MSELAKFIDWLLEMFPVVYADFRNNDAETASPVVVIDGVNAEFFNKVVTRRLLTSMSATFRGAKVELRHPDFAAFRILATPLTRRKRTLIFWKDRPMTRHWLDPIRSYYYAPKKIDVFNAEEPWQEATLCEK